MPATSTDARPEVVTGYQAVLLPYDVVGPNSTIICPGHPVRMEYIATKGFWVPVTTPCRMGEFESAEMEPDELEPAPQPVMKAHAINDAAVTRTVFRVNGASIVFSRGMVQNGRAR